MIDMEEQNHLNPFQFIFKNWDTILFAFLLAVAVWVSAVVASDPNREDTFANEIPLEEIGLSNTLLLTSDIPTGVAVEMRAPESVWQQIEKDPSLISAEIDLSGLDSGVHNLDVNVTINATPVQLLSFEPTSIQLTLEENAVSAKPVVVNFQGQASRGYEFESGFEPKSVTVSGAVSKVNQVTRVEATLRFTDINENMEEQLKLIPVDENGNLVTGVTLDATTVTAAITVTQDAKYKDVSVRLVTQGVVAQGYRTTTIDIIPPTITLTSSDIELIENMPGYVNTEPIDLTNRTDDIEGRFPLDLPEGVFPIDEQYSVEIHYGIAAIITTVQLEIPVQIIELAPGLIAELSPATVDVFLNVPVPVANQLTPSDVIIYINFAEYPEEGTYFINPEIEILRDEVNKEAINPDTIQVVITIDEEYEPDPIPSPTPEP